MVRFCVLLLVFFGNGCVFAQNNLNSPQQSGQSNQNGVDSPVVSDTNKIHKYNISDGGDALALFQYKGPILVELFQLGKDGKIDKKTRETYNMTTDMTVTGSRSDNTIDIQMVYKPESGEGGKFLITSATLSLQILTSSKVFTDYWRLSKADLKMEYKYNNNAKTLDQDITPRFGYGDNDADLQCGEGYSICAPKHLSWTCNDQQLKKVNTSDLSAGQDTAVLHFPDMYLQPFKKGDKIIRFGSNWDCEPLIPISVWTSILLTLGLAAIVWWALAMVGSVYSPSKFDDPKGPALMIAQTD